MLLEKVSSDERLKSYGMPRCGLKHGKRKMKKDIAAMDDF